MLGALKIGVIIPAYNESARLDKLLPCIPRDLVDSVVVVSDASTDDTAEVARRPAAASASSATDPRQSTTVPKTSKASARTSDRATVEA